MLRLIPNPMILSNAYLNLFILNTLSSIHQGSLKLTFNLVALVNRHADTGINSDIDNQPPRYKS